MTSSVKATQAQSSQKKKNKQTNKTKQNKLIMIGVSLMRPAAPLLLGNLPPLLGSGTGVGPRPAGRGSRSPLGSGTPAVQSQPRFHDMEEQVRARVHRPHRGSRRDEVIQQPPNAGVHHHRRRLLPASLTGVNRVVVALLSSSGALIRRSLTGVDRFPPLTLGGVLVPSPSLILHFPLFGLGSGFV